MTMAVRSHPHRYLADHVTGVAACMEREINSLEAAVDWEGFMGCSFQCLKNTARYIGYLHDLGKATPWFQKKLSGGRPGQSCDLKLSRHALLGAAAAYQLLRDEYGADLIPELAWLLIRRHHGYARNLHDELSLDDDDFELLEKQVQNLDPEYVAFLERELGKRVLPDINALQRQLKESRFHLYDFQENCSGSDLRRYFFFNYLFSLLTYADRWDVVFGEARESERSSIPPDIVDRWRRHQGFDTPSNDVDHLRNRLYQDVTQAAQEVPWGRICTLIAPTGMGKTVAMLAAAFIMRARVAKDKNYLPRIIYALPFLSIVDQNYKVCEKVLSLAFPEQVPTSVLGAQHHLVEFRYDDEETDYDTQQAELLLGSWTSEVVFTTFVSVFESLTTNRRSTQFHRLPGAVLLLDEIQALPHKYWGLVDSMLNHMVEFGGCSVVVATATEPPILSGPVTPLSSAKHPLCVPNRVRFAFRGKDELDRFATALQQRVLTEYGQGRSLMVVLNTIKSAEEVFSRLSSIAGVRFLSAHVVPLERLQRIKELKSPGLKVLVTTQLVEAGVDLDFGVVIRDFGPLDSMVQVSGRCNRSWKSTFGTVELLSLITGRETWEYIYDPVLVSTARELLEAKQEGDERDLYTLLDEYYARLKQRLSIDESQSLLEAVERLEFEQVGEFKLIAQDGYHVPVFVELDEQAQEIWLKYEEAIGYQGDKYAKRNLLMSLRRAMAPYTISYRISGRRSEEGSLPPVVHGIHYVGRHDLKEYYDPITGFHPSKQTYGCM
ncbi:MAG: CRISPR-associated helicase Cas3' [Bacillota bacterium]